MLVFLSVLRVPLSLPHSPLVLLFSVLLFERAYHFARYPYHSLAPGPSVSPAYLSPFLPHSPFGVLLLCMPILLAYFIS